MYVRACVARFRQTAEPSSFKRREGGREGEEESEWKREGSMNRRGQRARISVGRYLEHDNTKQPREEQGRGHEGAGDSTRCNLMTERQPRDDRASDAE